MRDARDAEDALLLENGDHAALLAAYHDIVVQRCLVAVRSEAGYDVAQNVFLRLLTELARGKPYVDIPYRVVVHQVVDWTVKDHFQGRSTDVPLPEGWDPGDTTDAYAKLDEDEALGRLFDGLPEVSRKVFVLVYLLGVEISEAANLLGMTRNAVDQALYRGHAKIREGSYG